MKAHPYKHQQQLAFTLSMQDWVEHFPSNQWKWMVCSVLNGLVETKKLKVLGYWVKDKNLFLIVGGTVEELAPMLREVNRGLKKEIERAWTYQNELKGTAESLEVYFETYAIGGDDVFCYQPLTSTKLIRLLLGEDVFALYSDPELQKMQDELRVDTFNSYLFYRYGSESVVELSEPPIKL